MQKGEPIQLQGEELRQLRLLGAGAGSGRLADDVSRSQGLQRLADGLQAKAVSQKMHIAKLEAVCSSHENVYKALEQKALMLQGIVDSYEEVQQHETKDKHLRNALGRARRKLRQIDDLLPADE